MDSAAVRDDLRSCEATLEEVAQDKIYSVGYPYGLAEAVTREVAEEAGKLGFEMGITMERSFNTTLQDPFRLARIDANDAPMGKQPMFKDVAGKVQILNHMTAGHTRFLSELVGGAQVTARIATSRRSPP